MNYEEDKPNSYCGIFGIYGSDTASAQAYYGLHALQHRGQEASGIVTRSFNGDNRAHFNIVKGEGLVSEVFADHNLLTDQLYGNAAIGHNRYSTTGAAKSRKNIQPFMVNTGWEILLLGTTEILQMLKNLEKNLLMKGRYFRRQATQK